MIWSEDQPMWMLQVHRELTLPLSVKLMTANWLCPRHLPQVGRSEEQLEPIGEDFRPVSEAPLESALTAARIAQASLPELDIQGIPLRTEYVTQWVTEMIGVVNCGLRTERVWSFVASGPARTWGSSRLPARIGASLDFVLFRSATFVFELLHGV